MARQIELYEQPLEELFARIHMPRWSRPLFDRRRFKVIHGGRAGGKSHAMARALLIRGMMGIEGGPVRIACAREVWSSVEMGTHQLFVDLIEQYGLEYRKVGNVMKGFWDVHPTYIEGRNGTQIIYIGLSDRTHANIRSIENVNFLWYDEAQQMKDQTAESLYPSIRGRPYSELWFSFNPRFTADPVCRDFMRDTSHRRRAWVQEVNYFNNPWLPEEMEEERLDLLEDQPERYCHLWLGVPDSEGDRQKILPESMLRIMFDAWDLRQENLQDDERVYGGLDVADSEAGRNALIIRKGSVVKDVSVRVGEIEKVAPWVDRRAMKWRIVRLHFDGGGIGTGMRVSLRGINARAYSILPVMFGGQVDGPKTLFSYNMTNEQFFAAKNAQMAWNLKLRLMNTVSLARGQFVDPRKCLFMNPNMRHKERIIEELSQPEWRTNNRDQIVVDKQPEKGDPSPDVFDSLGLAFHRDVEDGLDERRSRPV